MGLILLAVIPSWEPAQGIGSAALIFLPGLWLVGWGARRDRRRSRGWLVVLLLVLARVLLVLGWAVAALIVKFSGAVIPTDEYLGPFAGYVPRGPYGTASRPAAVYNYELACPVPDASTECDTYSSELRIRIGFLPLTRSLASVPCVLGEPVAEGEILVFPVDECHCPAPAALAAEECHRLAPGAVAIDVAGGRIR